MTAKFLSLVSGAVLLGGVSVASAAEPLTSAQMDTVVAGWFFNQASAGASALALGPRTYTSTYTAATAVFGVGSESYSSSTAVAY